LCNHRRRDGTLGCAGDDGDVIGVATGGGILRAGSNARIKRGVDESTLGQRAAAPPVMLKELNLEDDVGVIGLDVHI
jgi:hypothetical protein